MSVPKKKVEKKFRRIEVKFCDLTLDIFLENIA